MKCARRLAVSRSGYCEWRGRHGLHHGEWAARHRVLPDTDPNGYDDRGGEIGSACHPAKRGHASNLRMGSDRGGAHRGYFGRNVPYPFSEPELMLSSQGCSWWPSLWPLYIGFKRKQWL
jgi:hypothetical protein